MSTTLGAFVLALPLIAIFIYMWAQNGLRFASETFAATALFVAACALCVFGGLYLMGAWQ